MSELICLPASGIPKKLDPKKKYFALFPNDPIRKAGVGRIATSLPRQVQVSGISPGVRAWDFAAIALSVAAADKAILRSDSPDGWTRMIELTVGLTEPSVWQAKREEVQELLRVLTGDFWKLNFIEEALELPSAKKNQAPDADCVSLLSGGMDSLVGAIDLSANGRKPLFVSQIVRGDRDAQINFAQEVGAADRHCLWSFSVEQSNEMEQSTRGRSLVFLAFAALAATSITRRESGSADIFVPENGFIGLNVPLTPGRLGSLSTKTTHPVFTDSLQRVWDDVGIDAKLVFPYRFKTKGEVLRECINQDAMSKLLPSSVSCGKYRRHNLTHCGECVPCLVRRAAFLAAGIPDTTAKGYIHTDIENSNSKDVGAVATAYLQYKKHGLRRFVGGSLAFASSIDKPMYEGVVERGLEELGDLLRHHSIL